MAPAVPRPDPLAAARAGRPEALVDAHGPRVYAICGRLAPDPDDCYQEIWEKVLGALGRFDPAGAASIGTWILTIARRHLVDRHRRRQVRGEVTGLGELPADDLPADDLPVDHALDDARRRARLEEALRRLPDAHRRVVVLHHVHGVPLEALAEDEGVPVGTVKSRLHRGRARLAALLADDAAPRAVGATR